MRLVYRSAALSDVGRVRRLNEDSYLDRPEAGLWAVADGMGGHEHGDHASRSVIERLAGVEASTDPRAYRRAVEAAILAANEDLVAGAAAGSICGTTVAVVLAVEGHFAVLWAGDSRLYHRHGETLTQVTADHSLVGDLVAQGKLAPEAAFGHPLGNRLTRAVGVERDLVLAAAGGCLGPGDTLLLCTDGLSNAVPAPRIAAALAAPNPERACERLVAAALEAGGRDNVTVVTVQVRRGDRLP